MTPPASAPQQNASTNEAARWHVLLHGDDATEADWIAFAHWLEQPDNKLAYDKLDRALAIAMDASETLRAAAEPESTVVAFAHRGRAKWIGGAIAALAACTVLAVMLRPQPVDQATFAASATSDRVVRLADNTEIHLNRGAVIQTRLTATSRNVELRRGEASFIVTHDASRPFAVAVNGAVVRDIGTEFNIAPAGAATIVTVRAGAVAIAAPGRSEVRVEAGGQARIGGDNIELTSINPNDAFAWQTGRLMYHDATLRQIAEEISRYGAAAVEVDPAVADLRFSGVLAIGEQSAMLQQLQSFLPVRSEQNGGRIVLRSRA